MSAKNCKYISIQGIVEICDLQIMTKDDYDYNLQNIKENMIVFFHVDLIKHIRQLKYDLEKINCNFILVTGCSDYTNPTDLFDSNEELLSFINNTKIKKWFSQNCIIDHPKIVKIPIGLEYYNSGNTGNKSAIEQENELNEICNNLKPFTERKMQCYSNFHFRNYTINFGYSRNDVIIKVPNE